MRGSEVVWQCADGRIRCMRVIVVLPKAKLTIYLNTILNKFGALVAYGLRSLFCATGLWLGICWTHPADAWSRKLYG